MKTFNQLQEQLTESVGRYEVRSSKHPSTSPQGVSSDDKANIVGWFANKYNMAAGWTLCTLSKYDREWLGQKGVNLTGVFRSYTDRGNTSIIKVNAQKGTYAFIDNAVLERDDEVKFEKAAKYNRLMVDNSPTAKKAFNVK